jgi:hypothetical protein
VSLVGLYAMTLILTVSPGGTCDRPKVTRSSSFWNTFVSFTDASLHATIPTKPNNTKAVTELLTRFKVSETLAMLARTPSMRFGKAIPENAIYIQPNAL